MPYWWDGKLESVAQTLHIARPDLPLPSAVLQGDPVPKEMPLQSHGKGKARDYR